MNKFYFLVFLFLSSTLYGLSLNEVIVKALDKNPSLESINYRLLANKSNIRTSSSFANPILTLADNNLDKDQAMSRSSISLQQKLPYFGKRDSLEKIALAQDNILSETLQEARVNLVEKIKAQAYSIWELDELYVIIIEYVALTRQNINLFESYTATEDSQHMGIMSAELTLSDLRIKKSILKAQIHSAYARLSYLCGFKVRDLEVKLVVWDLPSMQSFQEGLLGNKALAIREKEVAKSKAMTHKASLDNYPDVNLLASYSYRENFDDFWTFGVGLSLPIYGTEDDKEEEARALSLSIESLKEDTQVQINTELEDAYVQMQSAYEIYHIVQDEALPQIEHMFELSNSAISTGGDLFRYIDILVQKLQLEQKSIASVANYNRSMAKIEALSGDTQ